MGESAHGEAHVVRLRYVDYRDPGLQVFSVGFETPGIFRDLIPGGSESKL